MVRLEQNTTFGVIGVKTWIYRGDILPGIEVAEAGEDSLRANDRKNRK